MRMPHPQLTLAPLSGLVAALCIAHASAQSYPLKPIHLVSPYPPGGSSDTLGRLIGQKVSEDWNQQVIIDNRPGAAGAIGSDYASKATPDGYTLLLTSSATHAVAPALGVKLPYDPVRDFAAITQLASSVQILVVHPSLPVKTVRDLIALAKSQPGKLSFASNGNGTPSQIAGEMFKTMAKVDMLHVPYKGGGPAAIAVISGEVSLSFGSLIAMLPATHAGKLRPIAVTGLKRSPIAPELPTVNESGLPGYEITNWYGVLGPKALPAEIVNKLNAELVKVVRLPDVSKRLADDGLEPNGTSPQEFSNYIRSQIEKLTQVVKASGAHIE